MTRIAVIYYSATGSVHTLAEAVAKGAAEAGAEVRLRRVAEFAPAEAIDANPAWRAHVDATADIAVATGFTSASNRHGGNESTLLALYNTIHHWGGIVVAPGYTDPAVYGAGGNPYGTSHPSAGGPPDADVLAAARYQGRRLATIARLIAAGDREERLVA